MTLDPVSYRILSEAWVRDAERWRKDDMADLARYALRRHVETRECARALAKQEKNL